MPNASPGLNSKAKVRYTLRNLFRRKASIAEPAPDISNSTQSSFITPAAPSQLKIKKRVSTGDEQTITSVGKDRRVGQALDVLSQVLKAAAAATTFFPPAESLIGGLNNAVELAQVTLRNEADRKAVMRNLEEARRRLDKCKGSQVMSDELSDRILRLESDLRADLGSIQDATNESWWRRWTEGDAQELSRHYGKLSSLLGLFITETVIGIDGRLESLSKVAMELTAIAKQNYDAISQLQTDEKFRHLNQATHVEYDAGPPDLRRSCTAETRKQILADLMTWATDDTNTQVYWLSGMAGTGKTTITYSFCEQLQKFGLLCTSYFCSRAVATSTNPRDVLPSIAFHLASYSQSFAKSLYSALRDPVNANIQQKELEKQFDVLVLGPTKASAMSEMPKRCVVVYDGADESASLKEVAKLIALFLRHAQNLPFKILISSRRDDFIKSVFERNDLFAYSTSLLLHDVEASLVEADIKLYILERLSQVNGPVAAEYIDALVQRSGSLFVYAAVICSFLEQTRTEEELQTRLQAVMDNSSEPIDGTLARPHDDLDQIYTQVLTSSASRSSDVWAVLLVILTSQSPLTVSNINSILAFRKYRVRNVVASLHAVLTGSDLEEHPITIFHASFRDFLDDHSRGKEFCDLLSVPHRTLAARCLEIMKEQLFTDDICFVGSKDTPKSHVDVTKVRDCIPAALEYSCTSWLHHLAALDTERVGTVDETVLEFFDGLILRWIECMAWLGKLEDAVRSLRRLEISQQVSPKLRFAAMDARRLILLCFEAIRDFPLEVYHSALVWLPKHSRISQRFRWEDWKISRGLPGRWDACESVLTNHADFVQSVCFSPDGKRVISGSDDKTIRIWNVETGEEERKLQGHTDKVWSVAISVDSRRVVSGSKDASIQIWRFETGRKEKQLVGHSNIVSSVAISPDGSTIISGSWDKTVRTWDVETGIEQRILEGHTEAVCCVAISYDGLNIVSGSSDCTVRIWHAQTGYQQRIIMGHSSYVRSVAISPNGKQVVSGSDDKTVRIWNLKTGQEERQLAGHSGWVQSVCFSADGKRVVSGSRDPDNTVRIWDIETGKVKGVFAGHTDTIRSVAIARDGRRVVSASQDSTVRIWSTEMSGQEENLTVTGHLDCVRALSLSPDAAWIVSGSDDRTVRIWNAESGNEEKIFKGHLGWVVSVAVSPDAKQVVSGSVDKTVRIWSVETGEVEKVLEGHSDAVRPVAFSRDGKRVAAGYLDDTLRIWTVETGEVEVTRLAALNQLDFHTTRTFESKIRLSSGWLSSMQTNSRLWIPTSFQEPQSCADSLQTICFGYSNGDIFIIQYTRI